jgi:ABC-type antimicrobial peptide transport system permease subunit
MRSTFSDLILGARLAATGGNDSRLRAALTALGVALGVALLLFAASVPNMVSAHNARLQARAPQISSRHTSLIGYQANTTFRGNGISIHALQRTGPHPPLPPGIDRIPAPGQMFVSPALARLLGSPSGAELARRLHARVAGTIADGGLTGPADLFAYVGATGLRQRGAPYVSGWGIQGPPSGHSALITLLVILMVVALLMPVGVFVATASRFGSEQRNARLAALRLLGLDRLRTARVAAGESLLGAIAGVIVGVIGFILILRPLVPHTDIAGVSIFVQDVRPSLPLAVLALVLVPVAAVGFALFAMRQVAIEPLGVTRRGRPPRRRLAWRLCTPALGFLLLVGLIGNSGRLGSTGGEVEAAAGIILVLIGVCALLPWFVEAVVIRAERGDGGVGGSVSWLLAIRRLRLDHGTSGRVVGAIGLAVAGAIALQTVFSGAESVRTGSNSATPQGLMAVNEMVVNAADPASLVQQRLGSVPGVASVAVAGTPKTQSVSIAPCSTIERITSARSCGPTSSYLISGSASGEHPGQLIKVPGGSLRIPANAQRVASRDNFQAEGGNIIIGLSLNPLVLTPAAAARDHLSPQTLAAIVQLNTPTATSEDHLSDVIASIDPLAQVSVLGEAKASTIDKLKRVLTAAAVAVLLVIGASLLVSVAEQLRERRRVLAVMSAFGTRGSTLAYSVLWQTALPVVLGLMLAIILGAALGAILMKILSLPVSFDWGSVGLLTAAGFVVVVGVTALTLPILSRQTSPEALRAE